MSLLADLIPGSTLFEQIVALSVLLGALGVIWKKGGEAVVHGIWAAILAAPEIPTALNNLGEVLRTDVVEELQQINQRALLVDNTIAEHTERIEQHGHRINELDGRVGALEEAGAGGD